jgi:hypothetical protein
LDVLDFIGLVKLVQRLSSLNYCSLVEDSWNCKGINLLKSSYMRRRCETELVPILSRKAKLSRTVVKLWITSLNSHLPKIYSGTRYGFLPTWRKKALTDQSSTQGLVRAKGWVWVGYVHLKRTLPAEHLTTRGIGATTLLLLNYSGRWVAWRGGETLCFTVYMVSVQNQDIGHKSAQPFFVRLSFW